MNKMHIAGAVIGVDYLNQLLTAVFPHLSPNLIGLISTGVPIAGVALLAAIEVLFPKTKPVVEAVQAAVEAPKA